MMKFTLICLFISWTIAAPEGDRVTGLKGFYNFGPQFDMYSGYLTLQKSPLIDTHYLFIKSKKAPETDDVVLWLNGGPGCSSLLGFLQELGPHLMNPGSTKLSSSKNPHSWNNNANILFFQSPSGVGFSRNQDPNYQFNDTRTGKDNLLALAEWYKKFPQFSKNKFWISGESYCGMYIPIFADEVLKNKDSIIPGQRINFQGVLIGNGVMLTQLHWRRQARNFYYSHHSFYGPQIDRLISNCKYDSSDNVNVACTTGNLLADKAVQRINPYSSIGICYEHKPVGGKPRSRFWYTPFDEEMYNIKEEQPGCSSDDYGITLYFNDPEVQKQLNMEATKWESCNENIGSIYKKDLTTIGLFENFKANGLKILLYSGNVDAQVSYVETEEYIRRIGWKQKGEKQVVVNNRGSLMGWITEYEGLTFYVINGAGHMVPSDKPNAALQMFQWFLAKK